MHHGAHVSALQNRQHSAREATGIHGSAALGHAAVSRERLHSRLKYKQRSPASRPTRCDARAQLAAGCACAEGRAHVPTAPHWLTAWFDRRIRTFGRACRPDISLRTFQSRTVFVQGVLGTLIVDHNGTVLDHELQVCLRSSRLHAYAPQRMLAASSRLQVYMAPG